LRGYGCVQSVSGFTPEERKAIKDIPAMNSHPISAREKKALYQRSFKSRLRNAKTPIELTLGQLYPAMMHSPMEVSTLIFILGSHVGEPGGHAPEKGGRVWEADEQAAIFFDQPPTYMLEIIRQAMKRGHLAYSKYAFDPVTTAYDLIGWFIEAGFPVDLALRRIYKYAPPKPPAEPPLGAPENPAVKVSYSSTINGVDMRDASMEDKEVTLTAEQQGSPPPPAANISEPSNQGKATANGLNLAKKIGVKAWHDLEVGVTLDGLRFKKTGKPGKGHLVGWNSLGWARRNAVQRLFMSLARTSARAIAYDGAGATRNVVAEVNKRLSKAFGINAPCIRNQAARTEHFFDSVTWEEDPCTELTDSDPSGESLTDEIRDMMPSILEKKYRKDK
jgi:hypothetical protein